MRAEVATGSELGQTLDGMMKEGKIVPIVRKGKNHQLLNNSSLAEYLIY